MIVGRYRELLRYVSLGFTAGFVFGCLQAVLFILHNRYIQYRMIYLVFESASKRLAAWLLIGVALGIFLWALGRVLSRARRGPGNQQSSGILHAAPLILLVLAAGYLMVSGYIGSRGTPMKIAAVYVGSSLLLIAEALLLHHYMTRYASYSAFVTRLSSAALRKSPFLLVIAVVLYVGPIVFRPSLSNDLPSVLLLTVDTLRSDHLGCYGYHRNTSPNLDAIARDGCLFLNAYAHAPITRSSCGCILTGLRPKETGTYRNDPLLLEVNTLAEYLKNAGYRTGAVVSNYVLRKRSNFNQGFDHYDDKMVNRELNRELPERVGGATTEAALTWIRRNRDRPFFLWVHYQDPHGPYTPPDEFRELFQDGLTLKTRLRVNDDVMGDGGIPSYQVLGDHRYAGYYITQYDSEIRYFDQCFGKLVRGIKETGLWENALVVFTSDHGEGMGEEDYYFAHGDYLYRGQIHIPLIIWTPEAWNQAGRVDAHLVQHADMARTVLGFAGIGIPAALQGRNLLGADLEAVPVFAEAYNWDNYKCCLVMKDLQVLFDQFNGDYRAYSFREDRFLEESEIVDDEMYQTMVGILAKESSPGLKRPSESAPLDHDELKKLRSLGYSH
jgi:arylsulfatase A-like enzyme